MFCWAPALNLKNYDAYSEQKAITAKINSDKTLFAYN